jgi:hypothetical protein
MKIEKLILFCIITIATFGCRDSEIPEQPVDPEDPEEPPVEITCEQSACWDASVYACRDSTYIKLFTRTRGWTGGDATYSVDLKNGKTLWMFGDSFIDQVSEDRSRPSFRLINNALVLQNGTEMTSYYKVNAGKIEAFAKPPETGHWYWPGDATVANGKIYMFMQAFGTGGGGMWDFFRTSIDLLTLNLSTLEIENNVRLFKDATISWGSAIMEDVDYTYVYGVKAENPQKYLYVARTDSTLTKPWEFYNGTEWSTDTLSATSIFNGVSEQFSVFKREGVYYFLTQNNIFGKQIYLYTAALPQGKFENLKVVYCTPETGGNFFTYNAFAHDHIYQDSLLISYNINSFQFTDLLKSADNYRPYFVKIGGWQLK